ncbi:Thiosulfate sulfurtransferase GlpE [Acaryochloris thomasi RCC1774]|uniref:tRNA uridine(34) hydroxylase n=2 Tax=Acaryochloris TaxID=155977 RepID=A0A2W1JN99_9CYAN|nr:Thiosulfate sulfurtransferase GlpE [Acaryochloris thomasi RCC1774]
MYKFIYIEDCLPLKEQLIEIFQAHNLMGTILLATEGLNGTVAGPASGIEALFQFLHQDSRFVDLWPKLSYVPSPPFKRMKVKVRREIVSMGLEGIDPAEKTGTHIDPKNWNELIRDPEVLVIDTRNQYEYEIGTFEGAKSPETENFRQFPQFVDEQLNPKEHPKVAMFCTGGIRCEKASAYLLEQGFEEVYQLEGGILNYLQAHQPENSLWNGECFVFDERVAVDEQLQPGSHTMCFGCRHPLSEQDYQSEKYEPGISCPHCFDQLTESQRASFAERRLQMELAAQRSQKHLGTSEET